ncbi:DUF2218 domain-containing protein [Propylenella binzhouense]|uniref:DUF2218 domain-containing protein n=1 Tax=Propylenella binzhouense TaxID=2555902 RepID=A0A964T626_9HYPH|nr:DUF2218 domain-containing protein [Propylenella binzhouense]MYZ48805.1 DUF2218 domain-containing protein [Propylenella binzhouense]
MSHSTSQALVPTTDPDRYIAALEERFSGRETTGFADKNGRLEFPWGSCILDAAPDALVIGLVAEDDASVERLEAAISEAVRAVAPEAPPLAWTRGLRGT